MGAGVTHALSGGPEAGGLHALSGAGDSHALSGAGGSHALSGAGGSHALSEAGGTNALSGPVYMVLLIIIFISIWEYM